MTRRTTLATFTLTGLLAVALLCVGCGRDDAPAAAGPDPELTRDFYDGREADVESLRVTKSVDWGDGPVNISTSQALDAAHRVFTMIDFKGMSRNDVWQLLGDPATIGDMGVPMESGPDAPMVYHFGTGLGGVFYILEFEGDVVVSVKTRLIE